MKTFKFRTLSVIAMLFFSAPFAVQANGIMDCQDLAAIGNLAIIDFEGIATEHGNAGAVNLVGDEFSGLTLSPGSGADGLFVGIPDASLGGNCFSFYAADFFPVSGEAVFSPDNCDNPGSPVGAVIVNFDSPVSAVGQYFLDAESAVSSISAYNGLDGTGDLLDAATANGLPDNAQAFRHVVSSGWDIQSVVIQLGGGGDGVGMDDLCFVDSLAVEIDIKPGSDPNCFNINGHGVIPVAILGSDIFDVANIVFEDLMFAGLEVRVRGRRGPLCHYEDVNEDGFTDLVCQFEDDAAAWSPGGTHACVDGTLSDGVPFRGCDSICVVP